MNDRQCPEAKSLLGLLPRHGQRLVTAPLSKHGQREIGIRRDPLRGQLQRLADTPPRPPRIDPQLERRCRELSIGQRAQGVLLQGPTDKQRSPHRGGPVFAPASWPRAAPPRFPAPDPARGRRTPPHPASPSRGTFGSSPSAHAPPADPAPEPSARSTASRARRYPSAAGAQPQSACVAYAPLNSAQASANSGSRSNACSEIPDGLRGVLASTARSSRCRARR